MKLLYFFTGSHLIINKSSLKRVQMKKKRIKTRNNDQFRKQIKIMKQKYQIQKDNIYQKKAWFSKKLMTPIDNDTNLDDVKIKNKPGRVQKSSY